MTSRSAAPPLSVGAPEALSLLHQRLLSAEEEAEALIQDMGTLGISRDQIFGSAERMDTVQRAVSPLKRRRALGDEDMLWQQCDFLVSRVRCVESLLQTLKLTIFRLETERELDPSRTVVSTIRIEPFRGIQTLQTSHLEQQLAALQMESEEERRASRKEVMKLRDRLQQAFQEREEARSDVQRLEEAMEAATAAKSLGEDSMLLTRNEYTSYLFIKSHNKQHNNTIALVRKGNNRLFLLRRLRSFGVQGPLLRTFYDSVVASAIFYGIVCWDQQHHGQGQEENGQTALGSSFSERLLHPRCVKERYLQMDVALAAEELKIVKVEMSQKLMEMKEQMRQESTRSAEAMKSHSQLLQQVEGMERVVEMERRQALLLRSDYQALQVEVQTSWQQLEEEKDRGRQLEECSQQLKEQIAMKNSLPCRQQTENNKLLKEGRELRAAADRVQTERSRAVKQLQEQDLLLEAARCNNQTEVQAALTDRVNLQLELEKLRGEHAELLQSSSIAQETAATKTELLERTIERLRWELSTAEKEEEAMRKDLERSKNELRLVVTKLEGERRNQEMQLNEAKREVGTLSSALQSQQDENRRLMGKVAALEQQQIGELTGLHGVRGPAGGVVSQTLETILTSQLNSQTLQQQPGGREQELATLKKDRLQAQREIRKHQAEVEKLQRLLTSAHSKNNSALDSLQKALDTARVDNKRLARSLEQAVLTNRSLHSKLEHAREQNQASRTLRDEELCEARTKIRHLSEELRAVKQRTREDYESSMKTLHREISELKMTVKDSSTGSGDLSKANQQLSWRVSELERQVCKQKAYIRQLRQRRRSRDLQDDSQQVEVMLLHPVHTDDKDAGEEGLRRSGRLLTYET
ncbi:hypothetical protein L3Q82_019006 [Scortum barcoo]|uniref:Uncharacterized protein n=1 Tax=Scortum barcoo TaxID=214431 RepID=A0ACB8VGV6_9TELE|nr:hypothetical protein L3Q82_019006 [Scortum barcoo]